MQSAAASDGTCSRGCGAGPSAGAGGARRARTGVEEGSGSSDESDGEAESRAAVRAAAGRSFDRGQPPMALDLSLVRPDSLDGKDVNKGLSEPLRESLRLNLAVLSDSQASRCASPPRGSVGLFRGEHAYVHARDEVTELHFT